MGELADADSGSGRASDRGRVADLIRGTAVAARRFGVGAVEGVGDLADKAEDLYTRRLGEDERHILDHCPVVAGMLDQRSTFEADPKGYGLLANVHVAPVVTGAVLTGAAIGLTALESTIAKLTTQIFDGPRLIGGVLQDAVARVVSPGVIDAVNQTMDTVPGSAVMGGWFHRIKHGHDLATSVEMWGEYGPGGGLQALYHLLGRDFWTTAGIPVLPAGTREVLVFLTGTLGLTTQQAAQIISMGPTGVLAGIFVAVGVRRLVSGVRALKEDAGIRRAVQDAMDASAAGDHLTATSLMTSVVAQKPGEYGLALAKAVIHHRAGQDLAAHHSYLDVLKLTSRKRPVVMAGGAALSLRGLAGTGALATASALARSPEHESGWLDHAIQAATTTVRSFEAVARDLADQRLIARLERGAVLPGRLLSGALNHYLAGQVAGTTMILPDRESILHASRTQFQSVLAKLPTSRDYLDEEHRKQIEFVSAFGSAQLAPVTASGELSS